MVNLTPPVSFLTFSFTERSETLKKLSTSSFRVINSGFGLKQSKRSFPHHWELINSDWLVCVWSFIQLLRRKTQDRCGFFTVVEQFICLKTNVQVLFQVTLKYRQSPGYDQDTLPKSVFKFILWVQWKNHNTVQSNNNNYTVIRKLTACSTVPNLETACILNCLYCKIHLKNNHTFNTF